MSKGLKLSDILVTIVIALVFGVVYKVWGPVYDIFKTFGFQLEQVIYGMWFIAATVAFLLIRKPGVALLAEAAAASGEFIMGSQYGLEVFLYGIVQGIFAEIIFLLFRYRNYSLMVASLAGVSSALGSIFLDFYKGYVTDLAAWNLTLLISARIIGGVLIAGVLAFYLVKLLEQTGVTNLLRPASMEDYQALDK